MFAFELPKLAFAWDKQDIIFKRKNRVRWYRVKLCVWFCSGEIDFDRNDLVKLIWLISELNIAWFIFGLWMHSRKK